MRFSVASTPPTEQLCVDPWRGQGILAAFSTRAGGVSQGPFSSLNLSFSSGDDPDLVVENRLRFTASLGISLDRCVVGSQIHGTRFAEVGKGDAGRGARSPKGALEGTDGMATCEAGVFLMGIFADCVPVFFFAPDCRVVALVHAGWRGTAAGGPTKMARHLKEHYGADLTQLQVAVGPAIGICHFEVGEEVLSAMRDRYPFADRYIDGRMVHLSGIIGASLTETGVAPDHMAVSELCTFCARERFFSHRRDGVPSGRMAGIIGMEGKE